MIQDPASDASKATTPFKSDGNPLLLRAVELIHLSTILESESGFGIIPGLIQLALIPNSPNSIAKYLVKLMIPALAV